MLDKMPDDLLQIEKIGKLIAFVILGGGLGVILYNTTLYRFISYIVPFWVCLFFLLSGSLAYFLYYHFRDNLTAWKEWGDIAWNFLAVSGIVSFITKSARGDDWPLLVPPIFSAAYLGILALVAAERAAVAVVIRIKTVKGKVSLLPRVVN